jgi:outer membrane receptor protein involved in Fe transport
LFANASRTLRRYGAIGSVTWHRNSHTIKAGAEAQHLSMHESFGFAVTDRDAAADAGFSDAALDFDAGHPFSFDGDASPALFSGYVQDDWQGPGRLSIGGGFRIDHAALLLPRTQLSPRIGMTYRVAGGALLRGSVSRFFQPPQPEYLLLSSSPEARVLSPFVDAESGGGADIEPEQQWAYEIGANHYVTPRVRVDGAFWYRAITNAADPNVFAGTTIIFPNAVATGRAYGLDLRVEVPRQRAWSGYASVSTGRVRQRGPITGGLFLEEEEVADVADGEEFVPDHDQAVVASGGVTWSHPTRAASVSLAVRYESGTPIGEVDDPDDAEELPGAEMVDFDRGRVKPRTIASIEAQVPVFTRGDFSAALRAGVQNIFNADYAYNFGNPFSGTHFGAPRTASIGLRVGF